MAGIAIPILVIAFWAQCTLRSLRAKATFSRVLFFSLFLAQILWSVKLSYDQYAIWAISGSPASYLLPPHQPISYFLGYAFMRFLSPPLATFLFAVIFLAASRLINKKFQNRFFYADEPYLAGAGIIAVGYPLFFVYGASVLLCALICSIIARGRASTYYMWIPAAILVILVNAVWLSRLGILNVLRW